MGIRVVKPYFEKILAPAERLCVHLRISSTMLNLLSFGSACVVAASIKLGSHFSSFLLAVPIFAYLRIVFSALDEMIRKHHLQTRVDSELLSEFMNRLSDVVIFSSFALLPSVNTFFVSITVGLILLSSYMGLVGRIVARSRTKKGIMGKADRMLYLGIYAVLMYFISEFSWNYFLAFVAVGLIATIYTRWTAIENQIKETR